MTVAPLPASPGVRVHPAAGDDHVRRSRELIVAAARHAGGGAAAVLGCGRGTEIPLHHLARRFGRVELVDRDAGALRTARDRCPGDAGPLVPCPGDLTGLLARLEPAARRVVEAARDPLAALDGVGRLLDEASPRWWTPPHGKGYALVVCSAVLTQLQAGVRECVQAAFLRRFPGSGALLRHDERWRGRAWELARRLEDGFVEHLRSLVSPGGVVYLADTVRVSWLREAAGGELETEGAWIATRSTRLADYLNAGDEIVHEQRWSWVRQGRRDGFWGRLYGVDAIVYRPGR